MPSQQDEITRLRSVQERMPDKGSRAWWLAEIACQMAQFKSVITSMVQTMHQTTPATAESPATPLATRGEPRKPYKGGFKPRSREELARELERVRQKLYDIEHPRNQRPKTYYVTEYIASVPPVFDRVVSKRPPDGDFQHIQKAISAEEATRLLAERLTKERREQEQEDEGSDSAA